MDWSPKLSKHLLAYKEKSIQPGQSPFLLNLSACFHARQGQLLFLLFQHRMQHLTVHYTCRCVILFFFFVFCQSHHTCCTAHSAHPTHNVDTYSLYKNVQKPIRSACACSSTFSSKKMHGIMVVRINSIKDDRRCSAKRKAFRSRFFRMEQAAFPNLL